MEKKFIINMPYYICNRTRHLYWLTEHGFKVVDTRIAADGKMIWYFKASQELVDCLNRYIKESALHKDITYELGPEI